MYIYYVYIYVYILRIRILIRQENQRGKRKRTKSDSGKTAKETQKKAGRAVKSQRNKSGSSIKRNKTYNNTIYNTYTNTQRVNLYLGMTINGLPWEGTRKGKEDHQRNKAGGFLIYICIRICISICSRQGEYVGVLRIIARQHPEWSQAQLALDRQILQELDRYEQR